MTTLSLNRLGLSYGATPVLSDITLEVIPSGSIIGVLGPNGVGKSTFLRALAGFETYRGNATLNGEELADMPFLRRTGLVGYLPQALPQGTTLVAYEAVFSACRAVRPDLSKDTVEALSEEVFDLLGIRHLAFKPLNKMSGGQRQIVGLAQVLIRKPAALLLDEPTSALDLRWQMGVFDVVRNVLDHTGGLCLMALHDINLAMRHCDYILLFAKGRVLSFGEPRAAMTPDTLRQAYRVEGRVETCSNGTPFVITDGIRT